MLTKRNLAFLAVILLLAVIVATPLLSAPDRAASAADMPLTVLTINSSSIAASTNWSGRVWADGYDRATSADVYWFIDQGSTPNTLTLKLQTGPDGTNWADYATLVSNNAADANAYSTKTIIGKYFRITATAGNTQTVTPTIKVVLR